MQKTLKTTLLFAFLLIGFFSFAKNTHADATDKLSGYAKNTVIGNISFNCTNNNSCATTSYGVTVNNSGVLSGKAWNATVGFISFDAADVAGCPGGSCQGTVNLASNNGSVTGFARIVGMGAGLGYIQLSSGAAGLFPTANPAGTEGVSYNFKLHQLVGSAWSDDYGWIKFSPVGLAPIRVAIVEPYMDFSINDWQYDNYMNVHGMPYGTPQNPQTAGVRPAAGPVELQWNVTQAQNCSATASNGDPNWAGVKPLSGFVTLSITPVSGNQYTLTCYPTYANGVAVTHTFTVSTSAGWGPNTLPEQNFRTLNDTRTFTLNFIVPSTVTGCTVSTEYGPSISYAGPYASFTPVPAFAGGPGTLPNGVSVDYDVTQHAHSLVFQIPNPGVISLTNSYWVVFRCMNGVVPVQRMYEYRPQGSGGSNVNLTSTPSGTIQPNDPVTINYTANYLLSSCILHSSNNDPLWDNHVPTLNTAPAHSVVVTPPTVTTTYYMDCIDLWGNPWFDSVTVTVAAVFPAPTISLVGPATATAGQSIALTYDSTSTASCKISTPSYVTAGTAPTGWISGTVLTPNTGTTASPHTVSGITFGNAMTTFFIDCIGLDASPLSASWIVNLLPPLAPTIHMSGPIVAVPANSTITLEYGSSYTDMCEIADGPQVPFNAANPPSYTTAGSAPSGWAASTALVAHATSPDDTHSVPTVTIGNQDTTFYIHCHGLDLSDLYASYTVNVIAASPAPTVHLSYSGPAVSPGTAVSLEYGSAYTDACDIPTGVPFPPYIATGTNPSGWTNGGQTFISHATGPADDSHATGTITMGDDDTTFFIHCHGLDGSDVYASTTVPVVAGGTSVGINIIGNACIDAIPGPYTVFTNVIGNFSLLDISSCVATDTTTGTIIPWNMPTDNIDPSATVVTFLGGQMDISLVCTATDGTTVSAPAAVQLTDDFPICVGTGTTEHGPLHFYER